MNDMSEYHTLFGYFILIGSMPLESTVCQQNSISPVTYAPCIYIHLQLEFLNTGWAKSP